MMITVVQCFNSLNFVLCFVFAAAVIFDFVVNVIRQFEAKGVRFFDAIGNIDNLFTYIRDDGA
jgi:hypothetical protein